MKISYVTTYDAHDVRQWSGLGYHIANALEIANSVEYIGNLKLYRNPLLLAKNMFYSKVVNRRFLADRDPKAADYYADQIAAKISHDTDVIFCPSTIPISLLEVNKPKVFYTDATFGGMVDFYDSFSNLCDESIRNGNYIEQKALDSCSLAIFSSKWAADTATQIYDVMENKVKVVPFGANLDYTIDYDTIKRNVISKTFKEINFLFIGVDWNRKGGDKALEVVSILNEKGINSKLHIAGVSQFRDKKLPDFVIDHGFISKSNHQGRKKLNDLFFNSHFFLMPTKAEAYGLVFAEASAYGLPCISNNTGGVSTIIKDDINGKLFQVNENASSYADYILELIEDRERYNQICFNSYNEYTTRLNWESSAKNINGLMREIF